MADISIFEKGLSVEDLHAEFSTLYPCNDFTYFSDNDHRSFDAFIEEVNLYIPNFLNNCELTESFESFSVFFLEKTIYFSNKMTAFEDFKEYPDKITRGLLWILEHVSILDDTLRTLLIDTATIISNQDKWYRFNNYGLKLLITLDQMPSTSNKNFITNIFLGDTKMLKSWCIRPDILDKVPPSFKPLFIEYMLDNRFFSVTYLKTLCLEYIQSDASAQKRCPDLPFKLMNLLSRTSDSIIEERALSNTIDFMGSSIYGNKYAEVKKLWYVLGQPEEFSFWKDAFLSTQMSILAAPELPTID